MIYFIYRNITKENKMNVFKSLIMIGLIVGFVFATMIAVSRDATRDNYRAVGEVILDGEIVDGFVE